MLMQFDSLLWELKGKPNPPPKLVKYGIIKNQAKRLGLETMVETGTYLGDFVACMIGTVRNIYSIEISSALFNRAKKRFQRSPRIHLELGDSRVVLPGILSHIETPCLFWLDAHFSGGITRGDPSKSPIMDELRMILDHSLSHRLAHLVMIDDAGDFTGENGYPTISDVDSFVKSSDPNWVVNIHDDMIHVFNSRG